MVVVWFLVVFAFVFVVFLFVVFVFLDVLTCSTRVTILKDP